MLNYFEIRITAMFPLSTLNNWTGLLGVKYQNQTREISLCQRAKIWEQVALPAGIIDIVLLYKNFWKPYSSTPHAHPLVIHRLIYFPFYGKVLFLDHGGVPALLLLISDWTGPPKMDDKVAVDEASSPLSFFLCFEWRHYEPMRHSRRGGREIAPFRQFVRLE